MTRTPIHVREGEIVEANEVKGGQVVLNNNLAEVVTDDVDRRSRKRAGLAS